MPKEPERIDRARELRRNMTDAERLLWRHVRRKQLAGAHFRRQRPIGPFIADFVCVERRLVVELDGGQHAERGDDDARRTRFLEQRGYRVLRFWNNDVLSNIDGVLRVIAAALESPPPQPSPASRERE